MPSSNPDSWTSSALRRAISAAGVALWSWNVDADNLVMDERGFAMWAVEHTADLKFEALSARIHPADRDRVRAAFNATRGIEGAYEIDFRIMIGEDIRWISARGLGNDAGMHEGKCTASSWM
jgi:hypothetical protein